MLKRQILNEIKEEPKRRPYGAKVFFLLSKNTEVKLDGEVSLLVSDNVIVTLKLSSTQPFSPHKDLKRYEAKIEGFKTAAEAERMGFNLTIALLWVSISRRFPLRLDYDESLPYAVYNRNPSGSFISGYFNGSVLTLTDTKIWAELINEGLTISAPTDDNLLLSMEIFSSANLEITERTKFISLVSSLEPLAKPNSYPKSVEEIIDRFKKEIQNLEIPEISEKNGDEISKLKNSLTGRLNELKSESIRQSLLRTVRELLPLESDAPKIIDDAYNLRSKILHEGIFDPYLSSKTHKISEIIRKLFAARIGKSLKF